MRTTSRLALALGLTAGVTAVAAAQTPPTPAPDAPAGTRAPRFLASVNGGYQLGSHDYESLVQFDAFEESATVTSSGELKSGPVFDGGVIYRLTDAYGVGAAFTYYTSESDVRVVAQIPHPLFHDQIRVANFTASGVKHSSGAIHFQGAWFVPFTTKLDFVITAGPSILLVSQDVVSAVNLRPEEPPFTSPQVDTVKVTEQQDTGIGFNAGADAIYRLSPRYGVGLTLRYVYGSSGVEGLSDNLTVGGLQIAGGLRVRF